MIEVTHLSKEYGSFLAVDDLSFSVAAGEVAGFLGPNGAGKSTTLRILAGFLGATRGDVRINGHSVANDSMRARESLGYMPETSPLYPEMRVGEYLTFRAELKGVARSARKANVARAVEDAGLKDSERVLIGHLSKGFRQRVGLADALVASPPLLILDEPTAGLDPNQIREVRALIQRLSERHTILVSTHILSEVEAMCTRAVVIARGKLVAEGTLDELRALRRPRSVRLRVRGSASAAKRAAESADGVKSVAISRREDAGKDSELHAIEVELDDPDEHAAVTERVVAALVRADVGVVEVSPRSSLEQVFAELTSGEVVDA
ncbi:MAG: ABC transporter ATP-binding protein [Polyangiaceae bacterium]